MKYVVTLLTLVAAIASYIIGASSGVVVFLISGLLLEGIFWLRIFRRK
jgi:hypothetical protein